jgi:hypothetical protein
MACDRVGDTFGIVMPDWRDALAMCIEEQRAGSE